MVVIECPHCDEEIEMDDDAYGLFACPYCEGEYEWGEAPKKRSRTTSRQTKKTTISSVYMYSPLSFGKLATSTMLLFIVIIGLNSNSWYGYSYEDGDIEFETNFGLTYQENILTNDEATTGNWEQTDTFSSTTGMISSFETQAELAELEKEWVIEYCSDSSNAWGETEEEFDARCDVMKIAADESVEWWSSWDSAGDILFFILIISAFILFTLVAMNCASLLNHLGWLDTNDSMMTNFRKAENLVGLITYSLILLGILMYWIFIPNLDGLWDINDTSAPSGLSSGLGLIWWSTLLLTLICLTTTSIAATKKN
ncbi:MAG: hypothetical protein CMB57_05860 [Euryarchaeota archaeon]|nr:hypothetical protein [Euryarchaeota archaeon]|tara:strand:- start:2314 stop:3249 length:936 start_codon:yes stop_codon:yes gene_type:complete